MAGLYVPLDVNYADDDKIIDAGPMGELLYVRALAFSKAMRSDGHIRANQLRSIAARINNSRRIADRLVEVGLWERNGDGWYITAWLKRNPLSSDVSETKSVAGTLGNHRRWHTGPKGNPKPECEHCQAEGLAR